MMRKYLVEGDLISAEVQNIFPDGSLSLHTRSFIYGKVRCKMFVKSYGGRKITLTLKKLKNERVSFACLSRYLNFKKSENRLRTTGALS